MSTYTYDDIKGTLVNPTLFNAIDRLKTMKQDYEDTTDQILKLQKLPKITNLKTAIATSITSIRKRLSDEMKDKTEAVRKPINDRYNLYGELFRKLDQFSAPGSMSNPASAAAASVAIPPLPVGPPTTASGGGGGPPPVDPLAAVPAASGGGGGPPPVDPLAAAGGGGGPPPVDPLAASGGGGGPPPVDPMAVMTTGGAPPLTILGGVGGSSSSGAGLAPGPGSIITGATTHGSIYRPLHVARTSSVVGRSGPTTGRSAAATGRGAATTGVAATAAATPGRGAATTGVAAATAAATPGRGAATTGATPGGPATPAAQVCVPTPDQYSAVVAAATAMGRLVQAMDAARAAAAGGAPQRSIMNPKRWLGMRGGARKTRRHSGGRRKTQRRK